MSGKEKSSSFIAALNYSLSIPEESVLELAIRGFVAKWLTGDWGRHSEVEKI